MPVAEASFALTRILASFRFLAEPTEDILGGAKRRKLKCQKGNVSLWFEILELGAQLRKKLWIESRGHLQETTQSLAELNECKKRALIEEMSTDQEATVCCCVFEGEVSWERDVIEDDFRNARWPVSFSGTWLQGL